MDSYRDCFFCLGRFENGRQKCKHLISGRLGRTEGPLCGLSFENSESYVEKRRSVDKMKLEPVQQDGIKEERVTSSNASAGCSKCGGELVFVDGVKQYVDQYGHLTNMIMGWIETMIQYSCSSCGMFELDIKRMFVYVHSGYYVLHILPRSTVTTDKFMARKFRLPRIPLETDSERIYGPMIYWSGDCMVCGMPTGVLSEEIDGSITGKTSSYQEVVCLHCNLEYHVAEYGD